ncbi:MAG: glycoside hydrolase family 1 protein [Parcubacteria group bacterium]|nr:glycoside hydrolase family 1 protein [Parcubacteria group bacterium]
MQSILPTNLYFPKGFLWGAATASYQVSGCDNTNWAFWERSEKRLAGISASGELEKHGLGNFICGNAREHDKRFREDFLLAKFLGHNAARFGAEPANIMPRKNIFDEYWLALYAEMVRYAKAQGITPVFNLWHWTIPIWWEEEGGWASPRAADYFAAYVEKVVEALGDEVTYWTVLNETNVFAGLSYRWGQWPPQMTDEAVADTVTEHLIEGHRRAYEIIKNRNPNAQVGIAQNLTWNEMEKETLGHLAEKNRKDKEWNWAFLDRIQDCMDFVGMNHYGRNDFVRGNGSDILSDMGWELYPEAIYHILMETYKRYGMPILITENGLADAEDMRRGWFIFETLKWVHKAIEDGVPVFGYLHWSLMDNFEWAYGFWPRFGLIKIDRENGLRREVRPSAFFYAEVCRLNAITDSAVFQYRHLLSQSAEGVSRE